MGRWPATRGRDPGRTGRSVPAAVAERVPAAPGAGRAGRGPEALTEASIDAGRRQAAQRAALERLHSAAAAPGRGVVQRGVLYDAVESDVTSAYDDGDYKVVAVTAERIQAATRELIAEYLRGLAFTSDFDMTEFTNSVPPENWEIWLSGTWDGSVGLMRIPAREPAMLSIHQRNFRAHVAHELGHWVRGCMEVPGWQAAVRRVSSDPGMNERQNEELRADMTGVFLRWLNGEAPTEADYADLFDEEASLSHPPGTKRKEKILLALDLCRRVDALAK